MAIPLSKTEIQLGPQGRVVIPAQLRQALDLKPGDTLTVRVDGNCIVLERQENILKRLRQRFTAVPKNIDLAEELITDRRIEAKHEQNK